MDGQAEDEGAPYASARGGGGRATRGTSERVNGLGLVDHGSLHVQPLRPYTARDAMPNGAALDGGEGVPPHPLGSGRVLVRDAKSHERSTDAACL